MQENNKIDITKKDAYITEVATLKIKYKTTKEKLGWIDDSWEEELIQNEMDKYAQNIRELNRHIASIEEIEKHATIQS